MQNELQLTFHAIQAQQNDTEKSVGETLKLVYLDDVMLGYVGGGELTNGY